MSESQRARMEAGFGPIRDFSKDFKQVLSDLIDPALIKQIEDEQIKLETNIKLVETAFVRAGQEIPENFAAVVQAIQNINAGQATRFEDIQKAQADFDAARKKYVDDYVKQNTTLATTDKLYGEQQAQLTKTGEAYFDQLVENQQNVNNYNTSLQNITKTVNDLIIAQNKYVESGGAITDFIAENRSEIVKQIDLDLVSFRDTLGTLKDIDKYFSQSGLEQYLSIKTGEFQNLGEQVKRFEEELRAQGIDITKAEYEEKLRLLREYLEKKNTEEKQGLADFNKNILDGIQQFQSAVTAISQVTADSFRFQIQMAEEDYQRAQENIVGDTEEANQKRLEADKIYNEKKKQLEKEAAKTSLQLSLAQAIANAAAALVKVTEQTGVFAVIAGTAIAAANFAAISQISLQLNRLDSFQKGGYIKAQGGMVVGPSHEYGGVKYAQGGVELEGGEAVINRVSSVRYQGLLSEINQAGGGKPLVMNNFDDSRIVEAIAKQRKEPLRAYVVERDITSAQQVTKRLESLSQI